PAVYEMRAGARVQTAAARSVLYEATRWVDLRDALNDRLEAGDAEPGLRERAKQADRLAGVLTPLAKAYTSEVANQVAYQSLQVHGGSGYMRDYSVERLCRDARVTNIYEGTTQLQHVAALGGVTQRVLDPLYQQWAGLGCSGPVADLAAAAAAGRERLARAVAAVVERRDPEYLDLAARRLCDAEVAVLASHLMVRDALRDPSREALATRFLADSLGPAVAAAEAAAAGDRSLIDRRGELLAL
ncbi:MAG: acyl-CoA dehydrogenase family protein, partial [Desulfuromonadales bacterium]